jgi:hypothetical protein
MAEILKDVFLLRINVNADPTNRLGPFNNPAPIPIVSSTTGPNIVVTATGHGITNGTIVYVFGHAVNTRANGGPWVASNVTLNTIELAGSTGNGVGAATGMIYASPARYLPCFEDGFQVGETVARVDIPTQHKDRGIKYAIPGDRNRSNGSIRTPLWPEFAAFVLKAPITLQPGGSIPQYHGAEEYWNGTLQAGSTDFLPPGGAGTVATGRGTLGLLFNGWSINFDRQQTNALEISLDVFVNQETDITTAIPSPQTTPLATGTALLGWPVYDPYLNSGVYVDFEFGNHLGNFVGWTGDRSDIRTISIAFSQALELDISRPNDTATLDNTWTKAYSGTPTCTVNLTLIMQHSDYIRATRLKKLRSGRVRLMAVSTAPQGRSTSTAALALGGTSLALKVIADADKFHVGDCVMIEKTSLNLQQVVELTAINYTTGTLTFAGGADVAMSGVAGDELVIRNTAWEIKVPTMDLSDRTPPTAGGAVKVISLTGSARLSPTTTQLVIVKAYNDDALDAFGVAA